EESHGVNLAWIIADHLYKHVPGTKENSVICGIHYVTKITCFLGFCVDDEIKKCSEPIDSKEGSSELRQEHRGLNSSWRDWNASLSEIERGNVWRDYFRGSSLGYAVGGLSRGDGFNDDDDMDE
ncbi:hypothetical protein Tco_1566081, partial [Tanacetum coccineum]